MRTASPTSCATPATGASGRSFHDGVDYALELGADIVVNTDGDNQYPQERIADLVQPILAGRADIVIADRQVHLVEHFSRPQDAAAALGSRWSTRRPAPSSPTRPAASARTRATA